MELTHSEYCNMLLTLDTRNTEAGRVQLKCDGTQWRTGGEVKGKLANGVGSQYSSRYLRTWCIQHYYCWCAHLGWTEAPTDLNELICFAKRLNLISVPVPSHFKRSLQQYVLHMDAVLWVTVTWTCCRWALFTQQCVNIRSVFECEDLFPHNTRPSASVFGLVLLRPLLWGEQVECAVTF